MTVATQKLSLADYLNYEDGTDTLYEWVAGELVPLRMEACAVCDRIRVGEFICTDY